MEKVQVVIQCVRCRESYVLPYPNPQEILGNQRLKRPATSRASFWCQVCGSVFPYKIEYLRQIGFPMLDQNQIRRDTFAYRMSFRCGQENCYAPAIVHTVRDAETSNVELRVRAVSMKVAASCQLGHSPTLIDADTKFLAIQVSGFEIANVYSLWFFRETLTAGIASICRAFHGAPHTRYL